MDSYNEARRRARQLGFDYIENAQLVAGPPAERLERLETLVAKDLVNDEGARQAVLGLKKKPVFKISKIFEEYEAETKDQVLDLSPDQLRIWRNARKRVVKSFVGVVSDKFITELTVDDAIDFRNFWRDRVVQEGIAAKSANREIGQLSGMIKELNILRRLGLPDLFRGLRLKGEVDKEPTPYEKKFIQNRLLADGALDGLNEDARYIIYVIADTGLRPSEIVNLNRKTKGVVDLRPGEGATYAFRENRGVMIGRVKFLERYGLSSEVETGQWVISDRAEDTLKELSDRNDIIKTMHRALTSHGLEEERGIDQYVRHGVRPGEKITGRVLAKGLAGDEMDERVYFVIDGVDGRVHHVEFPDGSHLKDIGRDMIVEVGPAASGPRAADRNIALNTGEKDRIYRPSRHLERIRGQFERELKDPESFVRSHVRRLEALRRAGHVERLDEDHWKVPVDIIERGQTYDRARGGDGPRIKILSSEKLERQIATLRAPPGSIVS